MDILELEPEVDDTDPPEPVTLTLRTLCGAERERPIMDGYDPHRDPTLNQMLESIIKKPIGNISKEFEEIVFPHDKTANTRKRMRALYLDIKDKKKNDGEDVSGMSRWMDLDKEPFYKALMTFYETKESVNPKTGETQKKKGSKNSRIIAAWCKKIGIDTNSKEYQAIIDDWLKLFVRDEFEYEIRWDFTAFDSLGDLKGVDRGSSCYHSRGPGEWYDAPITLYEGMGRKNIPTFIVYLYKKGQSEPCARCWGFAWQPGLFSTVDSTDWNWFVLSNAYYAQGMNNSIAFFVRALEKSLDNDNLVYRNWQGNKRWPIYCNGDTVIAKKEKVAEYYSKEDITDFRINRCLKCSNRSQESHSYIHAFCTSCLSNRGPECTNCGDGLQGPGHVSQLTGQGPYCLGCFEDRYRNCEGCSSEIRLDRNDHISYDDYMYCKPCFTEAGGFNCSNCNEPHKNAWELTVANKECTHITENDKFCSYDCVNTFIELHSPIDCVVCTKAVKLKQDAWKRGAYYGPDVDHLDDFVFSYMCSQKCYEQFAKERDERYVKLREEKTVALELAKVKAEADKLQKDMDHLEKQMSYTVSNVSGIYVGDLPSPTDSTGTVTTGTWTVNTYGTDIVVTNTVTGNIDIDLEATTYGPITIDYNRLPQINQRQQGE